MNFGVTGILLIGPYFLGMRTNGPPGALLLIFTCIIVFQWQLILWAQCMRYSGVTLAIAAAVAGKLQSWYFCGPAH